jgi:hypothetical protein
MDADGNGIPDALDKLVEQKVKKMLDGAMQGAAGTASAGNRYAGSDGTRNDQSEPLRELEQYRELLAKNRAQPRPGWLLGTSRLVLLVALSLGIGGVLLTQTLETIILERSLVAATLFCPSTCPGCSGPGRIFSWHVRSNRSESNVATQICNNPQVDVAKLTKLDVVQREDGDLLPYRLTLWTSFLCNSVLAFLGLLALGPLVFAWLRRRSLRHERIVLELRIRHLEARVNRLGGASWLP